MRTRKAVSNILTNFFLQLATIICGFILPKEILKAFGSEINGLVSSASQFIGYIALLESGVGSVTRAALYRPISEGNYKKINGILTATEGFFRRIAIIFLLYVAVLAIIFPNLVTSAQSWGFISSIVIVVSISTFFQYYFGITYSIFLQADQRNYIVNLVQSITLITNTFLSIILIQLGVGIHFVRLVTALIYIVRPFLFKKFVVKNKKISNICEPDDEAIENRWSSLGQHIAYFLHSNTDIVLITLLMNIKEVSVYSIYSMVTVGIRNFALIVSNGLESGIGSMIAQDDLKALNRIFKSYETLVSISVVTLFSCALHLFIPFIYIYTSGITDANYINFQLAFLMVICETIYCLRYPYNNLILAAGHFKQTQKSAFIEAGFNILMSLVLIQIWGLLGIVFATVLAMTYRFLYFSHYISNNILYRPIKVIVKRTLVNISIFTLNFFLCELFISDIVRNYRDFIISGCKTFFLCAGVAMLFNIIFYKNSIDDINTHFNMIIRKKIGVKAR